MTDTNRIMDDMARFVTDAMSVAQGVQREAQTIAKTQIERIIRELNLVNREDFDALKDMVVNAREQNQKLSARIAVLEKHIKNSTSSSIQENDENNEEQMGDLTNQTSSPQQQG